MPEEEKDTERDVQNNEDQTTTSTTTEGDTDSSTTNSSTNDEQNQSTTTTNDDDTTSNRSTDNGDDDVSEAQAELEKAQARIRELNKENQKRRHQLREWEELQETGVDPNTVREMLEEKKKAERQQKEEEGRYRELLEEIEATTEQEIQKARTEAEEQVKKMRSTLEKNFIDKTVAETLSAEGASVKLLGKHIKDQLQVIEDEETSEYKTVVLDSSGNKRLKRGGADFTVTDLVNEMKNDDDFAKAFPAPSTSGSGTNANSENSSKPPASATSNLKRSKMSAQEKYNFQKEYGMDEYLKLPMN